MAEDGDKANPQPRNHALTAALLGGAAAAAAGAVVAARAKARRNAAAGDAKPLNSVMEAAVTAGELARAPRPKSSEPSVPSEPKVSREPSVR